MNQLLECVAKYGFLAILLFCFGVLSPELTPKMQLTDLDTDIISKSRSGSDTFKQLFWLALFACYGLLALKYRMNARLIELFSHSKSAIAFMISVVIVCLSSYFWSDFKALTLKRAIFQAILYFVVTSSVIFAYLNQSVEKCIIAACAACIAMILLSVVLGAGINPYYELAGYSKTKNLMGAILSVAIIMCTLAQQKIGPSPYTKAILFMLFVALLLTVSKTSIALIILFFILTRMETRINKSFIFATLVVLLSVFIIVPAFSSLNGDSWHVGLVLDPSFMTGRGLIWDTIYYDLELFNRYLLGYGYGAYFGTGQTPFYFDIAYSFLNYIYSSHNGYIELLIQFGILSVPLIVLIFVFCFTSQNVVIVAAYIFPLLYNISEPSFIRDQHAVWILILFLFLYERLNQVPQQIKE